MGLYNMPPNCSLGEQVVYSAFCFSIFGRGNEFYSLGLTSFFVYGYPFMGSGCEMGFGRID